MDAGRRPRLEQIEVIKLIPVFQDVPLDLRGVDPGDEVFHAPVMRS